MLVNNQGPVTLSDCSAMSVSESVTVWSFDDLSALWNGPQNLMMIRSGEDSGFKYFLSNHIWLNM